MDQTYSERQVTLTNPYIRSCCECSYRIWLPKAKVLVCADATKCSSPSSSTSPSTLRMQKGRRIQTPNVDKLKVGTVQPSSNQFGVLAKRESCSYSCRTTFRRELWT